MTDDETKAMRDALIFGTGFMQDGKHVPMEAVMTDDLVKRLLTPVIDPFFGPIIEPIKKEAADELERAWALLEAGGGRYWEGRYRDEAALVDKLQEALQGLFDNFLELYAKDGCDCYSCEAVRVARAALGEKKDD